MNKTKKKRISRYISWICVVLLVVLLAVMPLLAGSDEEADGPVASILSGVVEDRDVSTRLIGGGTLVQEDASNVDIPSAVMLTKLHVSNGDIVSEGDVLAEVDRVSVMTAITQVQETLNELSEQIEACRDETISAAVKSQASGEVKIVYAAPGDDVSDVMLRHGALAVLSLDGLMAVQIERQTELAAGDTVCVIFEDDLEVDGLVESNLGGILTVTIPDDHYAVGASVRVTTEDGGRIGTGTLYIHSQWNAVAYSGTVSAVHITEGKTVSSGAKLMTLKDTGTAAEYQQLIDLRREYEDMMLELFQMYQSKCIYSPCDGVVSGIDENSANLLSAENSGWTLTLLSNAPNGDDESGYHNFVGCVREVGADGLILTMNTQDLQIEDYKDLSGVPMDPAAMTEEVIYTAQAPVYELCDGEWVQISASSIQAGDVLLFAGNDAGNFVWVVRIGHNSNIPDPETPTDPPEATEPVESTQPTEPAEPTQPASPGSSDDETGQQKPSTSGQSGNSGASGSRSPQVGSEFGGSSTQEQEEEYYSQDTVTIASVIPQGRMTVQITVDELDISRLTVGSSAAVSVDALSDQLFDAVITSIGNTGSNEGGNSKFTVELTLDRAENMLPGMRAVVYVTLEQAIQVSALPVAAVQDNGTETCVYTSFDEESGTLGDAVVLSLGISDGEYVQILSGLETGDTFYYAYYDTLQISDEPESASAGFSFRR